jgi:hypothetical protein
LSRGQVVGGPVEKWQVVAGPVEKRQVVAGQVVRGQVVGGQVVGGQVAIEPYISRVPCAPFTFATIRQQRGCQMEFFQTKYPNLGKLWMALEWKRLVF